MADKNRAHKIFKILRKAYPHAKAALNFGNPLEVLVATMLSAQCTDKMVNMVTESLFKKYKKTSDYANANISTFENEIRSTGFYKNKAKNVINAAIKIGSDFNGKVPSSMDELLKLPGVARKTANIVLFNGFGKIEGIAVDTHVRRLSQRLGFSKTDDPLKIEQDLMNLFDKKYWGVISFLLINHGRNTCIAKKPKCHECILKNLCHSKEKVSP
ncbi:MAG: endonuclease III [Candidatus Omnitrophota bacterium]|nr:MAG: endonuclease III [Candidatus Omnitrophota bacterium]